MYLLSDELISFAATVINISLFISGIQIIRTILSRGSSQGYFILPFVSCFVCCLLWLKYGLLTNDPTLIVVNLLGSVIEGIYTAIFFLYSKNKRLVGSTVFMLFTFLFGALSYTKYVTIEGPVAIYHHGVICSMYNVFNYAAPLSAMASVIKAKSTENLSFVLTILYFLCPLFWYLYGYLRDDIFIEIPNFLGILFGGLQMFLFVVYPRSKSKLATRHESKLPSSL